MKTVRASEIGTYLYCQRAWYYQRLGVENENQAELVMGTGLHESHARAVMIGGCMRVLAYVLLLTALVVGTIYILQALL